VEREQEMTVGEHRALAARRLAKARDDLFG